MHYTRIFAGPDGESHFEDGDIELREAAYAPPAPPLSVSQPAPVAAAVWTTLPKGWWGDWHPTPLVQWWCQLAGELEVATSDGETRRFAAGGIVRVEDTTGRGHTTRVVSEEEVIGVFLHIPDWQGAEKPAVT